MKHRYLSGRKASGSGLNRQRSQRSLYWAESPEVGVPHFINTEGYISIVDDEDYAEVYTFNMDGDVELAADITEGTDQLMTDVGRNDPQYVAHTDQSGNVYLHDIDTFNLEDTVSPYNDWLQAVDVSADSSMFAAGGAFTGGFTVYSYDPVEEVESIGVGEDGVQFLHFSFDMDYIGAGTNDGPLRVYETDGWTEEQTLSDGSNIWTLAWSNDDSYLAGAEVDFGDDIYNIYVYETDSWDLVYSEDIGSVVAYIDYSDDDSMMAVARRDSNIRIYETGSWDLIRTLSYNVGGISWNGTSLIAADRDGGLRIYNTDSWDYIDYPGIGDDHRDMGVGVIPQE